jgi:hypothetical protein
MMMNDLKIKWKGENSLGAGRTIFEQIPTEKRTEWAASVLKLATSWVRHIPEIDYVFAIARDPKEWTKNHWWNFYCYWQKTQRRSFTMKRIQEILLTKIRVGG